MNKIGKKYRKGKANRRILAFLIAVMMLSLLAMTTMTTMAASWWGEASMDVDTNAISSSMEETVAFAAEKPFDLKSASNVKSFKIVADVGSKSLVKFDTTNKGLWKSVREENNRTTYTTYGSWAKTSSELQTMLNSLSLYFRSGMSTSSKLEVNLKIYFSTSVQASDSYWSESRSYSTTVTFMRFADGKMVSSSPTVTYESNDGDGKYIKESSVSGAVTNYALTEGGKAEFEIGISGLGSASKITYGYQLKKAGASWTSTPVITVGSFEVKGWKEQNYKITATGMEAGVQYEMRGVIITDEASDNPKYTDAIQARYDRPGVSMFNVGSTDGSFWGGDDGDTKTIVFEGNFNNTSYDGKTRTNIDGTAVTGPAVRMELFYTNAYMSQTITVNGKSVLQDNSSWQTLHSEDVVLQSDPDKTDFSRAIGFTKTHKLPKDDNNKGSAYKIVLTDLISGNRVYSISNRFSVDSTPPTSPDVSAQVNGKAEVLGIGDGETTTVGGSSSKVQLQLLNSTDSGSGLKEYSYSMYYLSTNDASGSSTKAILEDLARVNSGNLGKVTYTDWVSLTQTEGVSPEFTVANDGYYRIDARAIDNAGRASTIKTTLFRVDLTVPSTPVVRLAKESEASASVFEPYDNRKYSDSQIWLFANTPEMVGKTIAKYEYSIDGGLTWKSMTMANGTVPAYYTSAASGHTPYSDSDLESFQYEAYIKISSEDVSGYQEMMVRCADTLGNVSLVSDSAVMRTSDKLEIKSELSHEGIEVAISVGAQAQGADKIQPAAVTASLKNAASQKINDRYYGTTGSTVSTAADFNPWLTIRSHTCTWASDDPGCIGDCIQANCPYATGSTLTINGKDYTIYTPKMVNVQGISSADAATGKFKWYRFDHTGFNSAPYVKAAKGVAGSVGASGSGNGRYYEMDSYVLYNSLSYSGSETTTTHGLWTSTVTQRFYHMAAFEKETDTYGMINYDGTQAIEAIKSAGYYTGSMLDWMFVYNNQDTKKTIGFTINDANVFPHSNDGYGFWFNTTIRQNTSNAWVVSGYMLYIGKPYNVEQLASYRWYIVKVLDAPIDTLMMNNNTNIDFAGKVLSTCTAASTVNTARSGKISVIAYANSGLYTATSVRHFRLITDGGKTTMYCWQEGTSSSQTVATLQTKFDSDLATYGDAGASAYTSGFKRVMWAKASGTDYATVTTANGWANGIVDTPTVTVGGGTIGITSSYNYTDGSAYGLGPIVGSKTQGHTCSRDTRIVFSNITMGIQSVRRLSEVVTEPQWGGGKAKFIANISDDSIEEFEDPVLSAQIQWRLINDDAKFIGWGNATNKVATEAFLKRIEGEGMYQLTTGNTYAVQIDSVATYITRAYYKESGFTDAQLDDTSTPLNKAVTGNAQAHGMVYSLEDAANLTFEVTPASYNDSTANADYPSGRWYILHDINGYDDDVQQSPRNGQYSDSLNISITDPGRYTIYFAPAAEDIRDGMLDPEDAVFDFIVNQKPVAQFSGTIGTVNGVANTVTISDASYDPDARLAETKVMSEDYKYSFTDRNGVKHTDEQYKAGVQLNGIVKTEWRWEMLAKNASGVLVTTTSDWTTVGFDGRTLYDITKQFSSIGDGEVFTVYQRVTDTVGYKVASKDSYKNITGFEYVSVNDHTSAQSKPLQQNITSSAAITYPPMSSFTLSTTNMYDTGTGDTDKITVTRKSSHPQPNKTIKASWEINLGGADGYEALTEDAAGNFTWKNKSGTTVTVLNVIEKASFNATTGVSYGKWTINKSFFTSQGIKFDANVVLRLTETVRGVAEAGKAESDITDQSARAVFYRKDVNAPSTQTVLTSTAVLESNGTTWTESTYEASKFLDVTNYDKEVRIKVNGSKDVEGKLAGYAYYLYDKDSKGNITAYYKLNDDGTMGTKETGVNAESRVVTKKTVASSKDEIVIKIGGKLLSDALPMAKINVAVWAYDNQAGQSTPTGANEAAKTKIEDIKLSRSLPAPPAIQVSNTGGDIVSYIGNDNGFVGSTGTDTQTSETEFITNKGVTIQFIPRQAYYKTDDNGDLVETTEDDAAGTKYYVDKYKRGDLTNAANIVYEIQKQNTTGKYETISGGTGTIAPAITIPLQDTGKYKIIAKVVNGANAYSETRETTFTIDRDPPSAPSLTMTDSTNGGTYSQALPLRWTGKVDIKVNGSSEALEPNYAYYTYSLDNGMTWKVYTASGEKPGSGVVDDSWLGLNRDRTTSISTTGENVFRVKAVDRAGNESAEVLGYVNIDSIGPTIGRMEAYAESKVVEMYSSYIVTTGIATGEGSVWPIDSDGNIFYNNVVEVPLVHSLENGVEKAEPGDQTFIIRPADGYHLSEVIYDNEVVSFDSLTAGSDADGDYYYFVAYGVSKDTILAVSFAKSAAPIESQNYMSASGISLRSVGLMRTLAQETQLSVTSNENTTEDNGDTTTDTKKVWTVSYNLNGASISQGSEKEFVLEGYKPKYVPTEFTIAPIGSAGFSGWTLTESFDPEEGPSYVDPSQMEINSNITFYAQFENTEDDPWDVDEDNRMSVTYSADSKLGQKGGELVSGYTSEYVMKGNKPVQIPAVREYKDYKFLGWESSTSDGEIVDVENTSIVSHTYYTAKYAYEGEASYQIDTIITNGMITSTGGASLSVLGGTAHTLTFQMYNGWGLDYVTINDEVVDGDDVELNLATMEYSITFNPVVKDMNIVITPRALVARTLKLDATGKGSVAISNLSDRSVVKESLGNNTYEVYVGGTLKVAVTPNTKNYMLSELLLDGEKIYGPSLTQNTYDVVVPDGSTEDEIYMEAIFEISTDPSVVTVDMQIVISKEDGSPTGIISPSGDADGKLKLLADEAQEFKITPIAGYELESLVLEYELDDVVERKPQEAGLSITGDYYTWSVIPPGNNMVLYATFKVKKHDLDVSVTGEGSYKINVTGRDGSVVENHTGTGIEEGSTVEIVSTPKDSYYLKDIILDDKTSIGAQSPYIIKRISKSQKIKISFRQKEIYSSVTEHSITAEIYEAKDDNNSLAAKPYSFSCDGGKTWTEYQESQKYTFTGLDVNKNYQIIGKAKDSIGNEGLYGETLTVYTYVNSPIATHATPVDDANNSMYKSVDLHVDDNNNPVSTEYLVSYSIGKGWTAATKTVTAVPTDTISEDENGNITITDEDGNETFILAEDIVSTEEVVGDDGGTTTNYLVEDWQIRDWANGTVRLSGLSASIPYILKVEARNGGLTPTVIAAPDGNEVRITLSPTSPQEASIYYVEQPGPDGDIVLYWDEVSEDIKVNIYAADGSCIEEGLTSNIKSYVINHERIPAGTATTFSYAYANSAGAGSTRTAVTKDYRDAYIAGTDTETHTASGTDKDRLELMKKQESLLNNEAVFQEMIVYPEYPTDINVISNMSSSDGSSGTITVRVDSEVSASGKEQVYWLGINAYTVEYNNDGTEKSVTFNEAATKAIKDKVIAQYAGDSKADEHQKAGYMKTVNASAGSGAQATWSGLNPNLEYGVYVAAVGTMGSKIYSGSTVVDNYFGSDTGIAGFMGKTYVVTPDKYYSSYSADIAKQLQLTTVTETLSSAKDSNGNYTGKWNPDASEMFAGANWNSRHELKIEVTESDGTPSYPSRITLMKCPEAAFAGNNMYPDNDETVQLDGTEKYLLVDSSQTKKSVSVNVLVWDQDGYDVSVTGRIVGVSNNVSGEVKSNTVTVKDAPREKASAQLVTLTFDTTHMGISGVYDYNDIQIDLQKKSMKIVVENPEDQDKFKLVVNKLNPSINIPGGGVTNTEIGQPLDMDVLGITTSIPSNQSIEDIRDVSLIIQRETFIDYFGTNKLSEIVSLALANDAKVAGKVRELLGISGTAAPTQKNVYDAVDSVVPALDKYVLTTEAQYKSDTPANQESKYILVDTQSGGVYSVSYWVQYDYAFTKNPDLCTWIDMVNGEPIVVGEDGDKQTIKLYTAFGGNSTTTNKAFALKDAASIDLHSEGGWQWVEARAIDEYNYYAANTNNAGNPLTVKQVYEDLYKKVYAAPTAAELAKGEVTMDSLSCKEVEADGETTYWIFTYHDTKINADQTLISGTIDVYSGVYKSLHQVGIMITSRGDLTTAEDVWNDKQYTSHKMITNASGGDTNILSGEYTFTAPKLEAGKTYYLWPYFVEEAPASGAEVKPVFAEKCSLITTDFQFDAAYYNFRNRNASLKESDAIDKTSSENLREYVIDRSDTAKDGAGLGVLKTEIEYLLADEYGNLILEKGEPKVIDPGIGEMALEIVYKSISIDSPQNTNLTREGTLTVRLKDNSIAQGHMVVRVTLVPDKAECVGNHIITTVGKTMEIFVLDDESKITTYEMGINGDVTHNSTGYYEYEFEGLDVNYRTSEELQLDYFNTGTGDLENTVVEIFADSKNFFANRNNATNPLSSSFVVNKVTASFLDAESGEIGQIGISAAQALPDGVYTAWAKISADNMKDSDCIWIKMTQIVGQSSMEGYIYYTSEWIPNNINVSPALVQLYPPKTNYTSTGGFTEDPVYEAYTDQTNAGYYKIKNILNLDEDGKPINYYIVVRKEGFITYNGVKGGTTKYPDPVYPTITRSQKGVMLVMGTQSRDYTFTLRLKGGDTDFNNPAGIDKVNMDDYNLLVSLFHTRYDTTLPYDQLTDKEKQIKACDLNGDGGVNALDRMALYNNLMTASYLPLDDSQKDGYTYTSAYDYDKGSRPTLKS